MKTKNKITMSYQRPIQYFVFKDRDEILFIIENYKNYVFTKIYNIMKKYDEHITVDDLFMKKAYDTRHVSQHSILDKGFPDFNYTKEELDYLLKFEIRRSIKYYAKLYIACDPRYDFCTGNSFIGNPLRKYNLEIIDPNCKISAVNYLLSTANRNITIMDRYKNIMKKIPDFDIKKEMLNFYSHEETFRIQHTYNKEDKDALYTLCCGHRIPINFYNHEINKHKGCPNCGVKICIRDSFFYNSVLYYDINDLFKTMECTTCNLKNAYGFYVKDNERQYTCSSCARKMQNIKKKSEILFLEETCMTLGTHFGCDQDLAQITKLVNKNDSL